LAQDLSTDDRDLIDRITTEKVLRVVDDIRSSHCRKFQYLHKAQHPLRLPDNKKIVVNLSEVPLEEAPFSALSKGLNYAVAPAFVHVKDILCRLEVSRGPA
jgi:hypothetical protein